MSAEIVEGCQKDWNARVDYNNSMYIYTCTLIGSDNNPHFIAYKDSL